jgi:4-hydroxy-tetrahydrodipicolinate synthase
VYLYHIPPMAQVGFSPALVERLLTAYPRTVAGMKDSSGDFGNTKAMLDAFAGRGFDVFVGSERFLLAGLRGGGVGCITATANVNAVAIDRLFREWRSPSADRLQEDVNAIRGAIERVPVIPALKAILAHHAGDPGWETLRPPLAALAPAQREALLADLAARGFAMQGLERIP